MKIGLITENSQCTKNNIIYESLKNAVDYEIINFGMLENDNELTYVQAGLLSAILLNSKCVDFIVTGCGTGIGAMMSLNSYPNVTCGLAENDVDAYLFNRINAGNAISIPYAKGFGWGSELNLVNIFVKLFSDGFGSGYPKERYESESKNRKLLNEIKNVTHKSMMDILTSIDQEFLYNTINRKQFIDYFFEHSKDKEITEYLKNVLNTKKSD